jgi:thioredoxin-related protein/TolA-binding protein
MSRRRVALLVLLLAAVSGVRELARGQGAVEVQWRHDYNAARKEAETKGLPIFLDFYTDHCVYCDKMDNTTYRDPKVLSLLNSRFIPLKIDGDRDAKLAELLGIRQYPTMLLAGADGKIVDTMIGYMEVPQFLEKLQRVLPATTNTDWMVADYQQAQKWATASEYALAIAALRKITADGQSRPVQINSQKLLADIEQKGRERMAKAQAQKDQGKISDAIQTLTDIMRDFAGLNLTREASDMVARLAQTESPDTKNQMRTKRAKDLLAQAKEFHKTKEYTLCIDRCSVLLRNYGDLEEGQEAALLYSEIKNNPEWLQNACTTFGDRLAEMWLALSDSLLKRGQPQQAKHWLERTIHAFPGTHHAESAQIRLEQLQGTTPTRRVDFQTPPN